MGSNFTAWVVVALGGGALLGASLMANATGTTGSLITISGEKSDWLGFWGSILGAGATISAGALAWVAAQKQILHKENAAKEVVDLKLKEYLGIADIAWRAIDKAIERNGGEFLAVAENFAGHLDDPPAQKLLDEIDTISKDLGAKNRDKISTIINIAKQLQVSIVDQRRIDVGNSPAKLGSIIGLRNTLCWLENITTQYSEPIGGIFGGRTKVTLYDGSTHQQSLNSLVTVWAGIENRMRCHSAAPDPAADR